MITVKLLDKTYLKVEALVTALISTRYWELKMALLLTFFSLVTSFPDYHTEIPFFLEALQHQFDHPLEPLPSHYLGDPENAGGVVSHLGKRWIRIVIPLIGYFLHIKAKHWFVVQHVLGFFFFFFAIKLICKYTGDQVLAVLFVSGLAGIFIGKWFFYDLSYFDGTAYFLILLAMYHRNLFIMTFFITLSFFIDERAIMVSPWICVWWYLQNVGMTIRPLKVLLVSLTIAIPFVIYLLVQIYLIETYGFYKDVSSVGLNVLVNNFRFIPAAFMLHYEAFWLMVATVTLLLWSNGLKLISFLLIMGLLCMNFACLIVYDVGRSTGYLFPALFFYLYVLVKFCHIQEYRRIVCICSFICILIPTHAVWVDGIYWLSPIFPKVLKLL